MNTAKDNLKIITDYNKLVKRIKKHTRYMNSLNSEVSSGIYGFYEKLGLFCIGTLGIFLPLIFHLAIQFKLKLSVVMKIAITEGYLLLLLCALSSYLFVFFANKFNYFSGESQLANLKYHLQRLIQDNEQFFASREISVDEENLIDEEDKIYLKSQENAFLFKRNLAEFLARRSLIFGFLAHGVFWYELIIK